MLRLSDSVLKWAEPMFTKLNNGTSLKALFGSQIADETSAIVAETSAHEVGAAIRWLHGKGQGRFPAKRAQF